MCWVWVKKKTQAFATFGKPQAFTTLGHDIKKIEMVQKCEQVLLVTIMALH
jgi:hypothetical protein